LIGETRRPTTKATVTNDDDKNEEEPVAKASSSQSCVSHDHRVWVTLGSVALVSVVRCRYGRIVALLKARSRAAVSAVGGLAVLVAFSLTASSQATPPTRDGQCAADDLRVVSVRGQGAAGTEFVPLRFELRRPGRCTLKGYPGVTLLDGSHGLDTHVGRRDDGRAPGVVQVDVGHPAYFNLTYRNLGPPDGELCHATVTGLKLIPPGDRQALTVRLRPSLSSLCLQSAAVEPVR
jgi:hypothetical protein